MIYIIASLAALLHIFKKCPKCGTAQRFEGKKKGNTAQCVYCKHKLTLKS